MPKRPPSDAGDVYQDTIKRLEPNIHPIDAVADWASIAISLKRIADGQEKIARTLAVLAQDGLFKAHLRALRVSKQDDRA